MNWKHGNATSWRHLIPEIRNRAMQDCSINIIGRQLLMAKKNCTRQNILQYLSSNSDTKLHICSDDVCFGVWLILPGFRHWSPVIQRIDEVCGMLWVSHYVAVIGAVSPGVTSAKGTFDVASLDDDGTFVKIMSRHRFCFVEKRFITDRKGR